MNKLLANTVGFLNGFIAATIIVVFTVIGLVADAASPHGFVILGFIVGCLIAILICGLLALLIDIRNELVRIRKGDTGPAPVKPAPVPVPRTDNGFVSNSLAARIRG